MTDQTMLSSVAEDLSYVRALAEEGRMQPLKGGKYLVMWGLISSFGLTFTGLVVSQMLPLPGYSIMLMWFGLSAIGGIMSGIWGRAKAGSTECESIGNKVESTVWSVGGIFLFVTTTMLFMMPFIAGNRFEAVGMDYNVLFGMISPLAFGVYAIALSATAVAARAKWLWPYVGLAFIFTAINMSLIWDYKQFAAAVIGIILVIIVPGLNMMRLAHSVDEAQGGAAHG